jgi:hypothetical protein
MNEYRTHRPGSGVIAHAGLDHFLYSTDVRFRTSALLWRFFAIPKKVG